MFKEKPGGCAHQIAVFFPFVYLAVRGSKLWFCEELATASANDKLWGNYPDAQALVLTMFAFQIWDYTVTLVTPELCKMEHIAHHASSAVLCLLGLMNGHHGFLMYYGAFFFGVSEISSMPLALVDLFRMNKELASKCDCVNEICRVSFAVLFLLIRCVYWPYVSFDFWTSMLTGSVPVFLAIIWLLANIALTLLQYFWGFLIVKATIKMIKGDKSGREVEAREPTFGTVYSQKLLDA